MLILMQLYIYNKLTVDPNSEWICPDCISVDPFEIVQAIQQIRLNVENTSGNNEVQVAKPV